jgi:hypothetical protein
VTTTFGQTKHTPNNSKKVWPNTWTGKEPKTGLGSGSKQEPTLVPVPLLELDRILVMKNTTFYKEKT